MSKNRQKPEAKTINAWSLELGRDKRSLSKKLRAAGIAPAGQTKHGCPLYRKADVLAVLAPPPPTEASGLKERKLFEEHRKLKLANDRREGVLVEKSLVMQSINRFNSRVDAYLSRLENEWPSLLCGLEAPAIRAYLKRGTDSIRQEISDSYREWLC